MAWTWSYTEEGYQNVHDNIHRMSREELIVCLAEFAAHEKCPEDWDDEEDGDWQEYRMTHEPFDNTEFEAVKKRLTESCLQVDTLANEVSRKATEFATCTNGGFEAWVCPSGCHTVSLDPPEDQGEDK